MDNFLTRVIIIRCDQPSFW